MSCGMGATTSKRLILRREKGTEENDSCIEEKKNKRKDWCIERKKRQSKTMVKIKVH